MKNTSVEEETRKVFEDAANIWYTRANGVIVSRKCPICRLMERITPDPDDPCIVCPISIENNDDGCPDFMTTYGKLKDETSIKAAARQIAEHIDNIINIHFGGN